MRCSGIVEIGRECKKVVVDEENRKLGALCDIFTCVIMYLKSEQIKLLKRVFNGMFDYFLINFDTI